MAGQYEKNDEWAPSWQHQQFLHSFIDSLIEVCDSNTREKNTRTTQKNEKQTEKKEERRKSSKNHFYGDQRKRRDQHYAIMLHSGKKKKRRRGRYERNRFFCYRWKRAFEKGKMSNYSKDEAGSCAIIVWCWSLNVSEAEHARIQWMNMFQRQNDRKEEEKPRERRERERKDQRKRISGFFRKK